MLPVTVLAISVRVPPCRRRMPPPSRPAAYVRELLIALTSADVDLRSLLPDVWIAAHPGHFSYSTAAMRPRRPPVRGSGGARNAGPSQKSGSPRIEVVNRPGLIGRLDQRNLRLLTGQWS
jgi:hypothetical protein